MRARRSGERGQPCRLSPQPDQNCDCHSATPRQRLRDDIRRDLILDESDAVAQLQLAFFQPLQPQEIRRRRLMQGIDRGVQVAVFLLKPGEFGSKFALILGHDMRNLESRRGCNGSEVATGLPD